MRNESSVSFSNVASPGKRDPGARMTFEEPRALEILTALTQHEIDELPFGVIAMSLDGIVTGYSMFESRASGYSVTRVLGRAFFTDVAPCTNNYMVAGRFDEPTLDEVLNYVFTFKVKPTPVRLRLLKSAKGGTQYVLVQRS